MAADGGDGRILRTPGGPLAVVRPDWVDSYGHMNMAFYLAVFDMATDQLWPHLGLGPGFKARGLGTFAAETWVNYLREVREGMPLVCTNEVLAYDAKRLLAVHRMLHAEEGWLAPSGSNLKTPDRDTVWKVEDGSRLTPNSPVTLAASSVSL